MTERRVRRIRPVRWRDARLWIGIGLVVGAMLIGSRLASGDDDRVLVWSATSDMSMGAEPTEIALSSVALGSAVRHYFPADQPPVGRLLTAIPSGALIPRQAVQSEGVGGPQRFITLAVEATRVPHQLTPGQRVDVWSSDADGIPILALPDVLVAHVTTDSGGLRGNVTVVVDVSPDEVGAILTASRSGVIDLIGIPLP